MHINQKHKSIIKAQLADARERYQAAFERVREEGGYGNETELAELRREIQEYLKQLKEMARDPSQPGEKGKNVECDSVQKKDSTETTIEGTNAEAVHAS